MEHFRKYANGHKLATIGYSPRLGKEAEPIKNINRPRRPSLKDMQQWANGSRDRMLPSLTGNSFRQKGKRLTQTQLDFILEHNRAILGKKKKHTVRQGRRKRDFLRREAERKKLKRGREFELRLAAAVGTRIDTPSQAYLEAMDHDDVVFGRSRVMRLDGMKPIKPIFEAIGGEG